MRTPEPLRSSASSGRVPRTPNVLIAGSAATSGERRTARGLWASEQPGTPRSIGDSRRDLAFAPSDPTCGTYAVGTISPDGSYRTSDAGVSMAKRHRDPPRVRALNDVAFDPANANVLYAAISGLGGPHLYGTTNALSPSPSWFAIDAGIPRRSDQRGPGRPRVVERHLRRERPRPRSERRRRGLLEPSAERHPEVAIYDLVADAGTARSSRSRTGAAHSG